MPNSLYNFQYVPLTGRLPGKSFVSQTEQAINGLAQYVYENSTNYEAVKAIAQKAEEDSSSALEYSEEALDKAQTALETVGRAYIKTTSVVDLNNYFDSELLYITNVESANLPADITGYLTVMSTDSHDYCMQVYICDSGDVYKRSATIADSIPTFGAWSETPITMSVLQPLLNALANADASNIGINADTDNSIAWGDAIGGGEIANDEQRLITGGTVYPLSVDVGIADKRITNIEKLLQGNLYDYQTDNSLAYTKSVPSGAMPYAGLEKVGGKTIVWNQLGSPYSVGDWRRSRCTVVEDSDSAFTATCNSNAYAYFTTYQFETLPGSRVYLYSCEFKFNTTNQPTTFRMHDSFGLAMDVSSVAQNTFTQFKKIITAGSEKSYNIDFELVYASASDVTIGDTFSVKNYMLIDLTSLYGAGNEPTTVEEFEAMFPASYYAYNAGTLLSAGVTSIISTSSNLIDESKYVSGIFNAETKVLTTRGGVWEDVFTGSHGQTATVSNLSKILLLPAGTYTVANDSSTATYLDVYSVDSNGSLLSTLRRLNSSNRSGSFTLTANTYVTIRMSTSGSTATKLRITRSGSALPYMPYWKQTYPIPAEIRALEGYGWSCPDHYNYIDYENKKFMQEVGSRAYASGDESDSTVITDGTNTYYPLTTAVETDISAYITDDNLINVEANGTLTFPNQHGDDYLLPVPSDVTYMIDLQEALGG